MNRELEKGYKFSVSEVKGSFEIKEIIGRGASCVVYRAEFTDEHGNITEHLLKEYNPKSIELYRDNDGELCVENTDEQDVFDAGLERFKLGYEKQMHIRRTIDELKNSTSNIQGVYRANGTQYIDMTCFNGVTYSKVQEKSLYELLRRMKALTQVIGNYHTAGFLHLDIKPDNIFTIPETSELVMLFDFDSVTEKDNIGNKSVLSYTKSWAAPEQISGKHEKICEATDLFAIGEIIFFEIFGMHSDSLEHRRSFSKYDFDYESPIFENVNPKVYPLLTEVFHRTICTAAGKRFQFADELVEFLDRLITLADPKAPFIKSSLTEPQSFFVGREREIDEIHAHLNDNRILFVNGVGGIGKSELVKQYAKKYKSEYDTVIFAPYVSDMNMLISDDGTVPVYNLFQYPAEQPAEYIQRKWRKLKELCDENTLIIVDNLDRDDDPDLNKLLELGCKFLITTRVDFSEYGYEQLSLDTLASREEINAIFNEYYKKPLDEKSKGCVDEIIDIVGGHTMTVELLAKQMTAGRITPEKMLSKLKEGGISGSGSERVRTGKDGVLSTRSAYDHIRALFDVSELSEEEIYILANLSLVPHTGISTEFFHDLCELESYDDINDLILNGWIRCDREKDYISLHPVVGDLAFDLLDEREVDVSKFLRNLTKIAKENDFEKSGLESREKFAYFLYDVSLKVIRIVKTSETVADFLLEVTSGFKGFVDFKHAIACCNKSLKHIIALYSDNHIKVAETYDKLASLYRIDGKFELSLEYCLKALEIRKNYYGEENIETTKSYVNLGEVYYHLEWFEKAEKYITKALTIRKKVYGDEHEDTAETYNNLGAVCYKLGDIEKSGEYYIKALEIRKRVYGEEHSEIAITYNNLGVYYKQLHDLKRAKEYYIKSLNVYKSLYGDFHVNNTLAYTNLGILYEEIGNYREAEECYTKALQICKKVYGDEHIATIDMYKDIGSLYMQLDNFKKAEEYLVKYIDAFKKIYSNNPEFATEDYIITYSLLGFCYYMSKNYVKALHCCKTALKISNVKYGGDPLGIQKMFRKIIKS